MSFYGLQKLKNKLAVTANYYGAGRPVSKLTGACGARINLGRKSEVKKRSSEALLTSHAPSFLKRLTKMSTSKVNFFLEKCQIPEDFEIMPPL